MKSALKYTQGDFITKVFYFLSDASCFELIVDSKKDIVSENLQAAQCSYAELQTLSRQLNQHRRWWFLLSEIVGISNVAVGVTAYHVSLELTWRIFIGNNWNYIHF